MDLRVAVEHAGRWHLGHTSQIGSESSLVTLDKALENGDRELWWPNRCVHVVERELHDGNVTNLQLADGSIVAFGTTEIPPGEQP